MNMSDRSLREITSLLIARREAILAALAESQRDLAQIRSARAETADDEHDPEGSTLSSDWSRVVGLQGDATVQLEEVDRAMVRLREGTYGICVSCGRRIPVGRLRARPWTQTCVDCAA